MQLKRLAYRASLDQYQKQAGELLEAYRTSDSEAIRVIRGRHPRFLDPKIPWLPLKVSDSEVQGAGLALVDAQLTIARWYDFQNWEALVHYVEAVARDHSPVYEFETGVEAVIAGEVGTLESLLRENPELVRARSTRVTHFDPSEHRATLLHYVAANGVEGYRQKCPENAVAVAEILLKAGADVDALADLYGGQCTTMSLLVSSSVAAEAGMQVPLVDKLLDFGAAIEGRGSGQWVSPLMTALVFWCVSAAEALVRRGAKVDRLAAAAGLGWLEDARRLLTGASSEDRHRALALAAQHGHVEIVRMLLDAGEDPNRFNPKGHHAHSTPLHQAAGCGHDSVVRLLVERGARLGVRDTIYGGTPQGWAEYAGRPQIAEYLRGQSGNVTDELPQ